MTHRRLTAASVLFVLLASSCTTGLLPQQAPEPQAAVDVGLPWWNDRVFYSVAVADSPDSDGNGLGDLAGLIGSLDSLNDGDPATLDDVGVTGLWLTGVLEASPDGGGVVDFLRVDPAVGDNAAFLELTEAAHHRGLAVIVDLPLNDTSIDHPWFVASREGEGGFGAYYVWRDTPLLPEDRWTRSERGFYFHAFEAATADLNLTDRSVGEALVDVGEFWLTEMGVDGLGLPSASYFVESGSDSLNTAETKAWLAEYDDRLDSFVPNSVTIAEISGSTAVVSTFVGAADLVTVADRPAAILAGLESGSSAPLVATQRELAARIPDAQYLVRLMDEAPDRLLEGDAGKVAATLLLTEPGIPVLNHAHLVGPARDPLLDHYRDLVRIRAEQPALRLGRTGEVETSSENLYAFLRSVGDHQVLVMTNLSNRPASEVTLRMDAALVPQGREPSMLLGTGPIVAMPPPVDGFVVWSPVGSLDAYESLIIRLE